MEGCFSNWRPVASGVPQGLFLGPLQFVIYINGLNDNLVNAVNMFADDTKIGGTVDSKE